MTSLFLAYLFLNDPAASRNVFCIDTRNSDNIIELVIDDNGQVRGATFSSETDGSIHNRPLRPGEYSFNGSTVSYAGDTYSCQ